MRYSPPADDDGGRGPDRPPHWRHQAKRQKCGERATSQVRAMTETTADLKPADAITGTWGDTVPAQYRPFLRLMRLDRPHPAFLLFWPCVFGLVLGAIGSERPFSSWHD